MKDDERRFLAEMQRLTRETGHAYARKVAAELGMNEKRAFRICEKWEDKGWAESGVSSLACWLTPEGMAVDPERQP